MKMNRWYSKVLTLAIVVLNLSRRATGVHANAAMRLDDYLKNTCLLDPVGGSVSFYDTKVRLVKVA
jgi:hypothetical protein